MSNQIIQGLLKNSSIRFTAITGRELVNDAKRIHCLSRTATAALGRELLMVAMMAGQLKNETDSVSAIISGGGPGGNMVCVGRKGPFVKGCTGDPGYELPPNENGKLDVGGYVGRNGKLTVIRDLSLKEPYVGMCHLVSGEVAEDFAEYFTVSEQQPSLVYLGVRLEPLTGEVLGAGGMLIQPLPGCPEQDIDYIMSKTSSITMLAYKLSQLESLQGTVLSMFSDSDVTITEEMNPKYQCDCSRERMERALLSVGREELSKIIEEDGQAELCCHFCNSKYAFTRAELESLLQEGACE